MDILSIVNTVFSAIVKFLPGSPFQRFITSIGKIPYVAELNWVFPISECIAITQAWVFSIGLFYAYSVILRIIKVAS